MELPRNPDTLENVYISPDYLVKAYEYENYVEMSRGDWERVKLLLKRPVLDLKAQTVRYIKNDGDGGQMVTEVPIIPLEDFERNEK